jgi:predicted RNA binding protein YcfA (HicA-like mRNA interferase family)
VPRLSPCSRPEFIRKLRNLGYQGPFRGGDHEYMAKPGHGNIKVPNPHSNQSGISVDLYVGSCAIPIFRGMTGKGLKLIRFSLVDAVD